MAIFSGTWRAEDKTAFAANAFSCQTYDGGGTAQKLTTKRDLPWAVKAARYAFYEYAHQWNYKLNDYWRGEWHDYLEGCRLDCRQRWWPDPPTYSATCGYAACNAAQLCRHAYQLPEPIDFRDHPGWSITAAVYDPATEEIEVTYQQTLDYPPDAYDGIVVYQINPRSFLHLWSCWHTCIIAHDVYWPPTQPVAKITGKSRWPVAPGEEGQVMVRVWHHHQHILTRRVVTHIGD